MVKKGEDFWLHQQHSAWPAPNPNYMHMSLQTRREESSSVPLNPHSSLFSANVDFPRVAAAGLPGSVSQTNQFNGLFQCSTSQIHSFLPTSGPYFKEKQFPFPNGCCGKVAPNPISLSIQKRFLIFDQTENGTSITFSSAYPATQRAVVPTKPIYGYHLGKEELAAEVDRFYLTKPILEKVSDGNHINGEGSEKHEDTEEINALLYSDDDSSGEDDEELSTGHSPIEESNEQRGQVEEITEEVASSNGPTKRHKLLDGSYNKSLLMDTASSVLGPDASYEGEDHVESNFANSKTKRDGMDSIIGNKRSRKDRIRETLGILESIIPGAIGKDPLLVLDEAIIYLKSLKLKAKGLGLGVNQN